MFTEDKAQNLSVITLGEPRRGMARKGKRVAEGTRTPDSQIHNLDNTPEIAEKQGGRPESAAHAQRAEAGNVVSDPDLRMILNQWASLPEPIRAGIVAMVKAAASRE